MKEKWSSGKIAAVAAGSICGGLVLLTIFCIDVFRLTRVIFSYGNESYTQSGYGNDGSSADFDRGFSEYGDENSESYGGYNDYGNYGGYGDYDYYGYDDDDYGNNYDYNYGEDADSEYYEFHDAIRNDLSYEVEFEYYDEEFGSGNVLIVTTYPVVYSGTDVDLSGVNNVIQKETEQIREYAASVAEEISEESFFSFVTDSYVTYMDEETLSIIYVEYGYLDDETYESYVVSVNIDMESGLAMTNSQILDIDDAFSIEFRNRSAEQNGDMGGLSMFSDQEITYMLTDDDSLIIFYTPMGMEVGFNYNYGWVTVTYRDYEKYKSHF